MQMSTHKETILMPVFVCLSFFFIIWALKTFFRLIEQKENIQYFIKLHSVELL